MASGKLSKGRRVLILSMMIVLLVASPVAASVAPVLTGAGARAPGKGPGSEPAHALALLQLGYQQSQDACAAGEARAQADENGTIWFVGGCVFTTITLIASYFLEPSPPASALVGKDDQYVAQYTDCYQSVAKGIRQKSALNGFFTGCAVLGVTYVILIVAASSAAGAG